ncbi:enhancer of polycomb homolog 2-like [Cucurbita maxima]|uniref:Enhancer of polycomb-like protein n=1 Tax=Cucurbita maxima TaxID=3661 RepID=A0A6J1I353_CUCMA|nr:enhancer of polycomb homolog 2-like [Cucurbita maxima]XP_022969607.1 enhancer of polycomb homolog 2-like [Cucurbita maxima]XP_022969614.1 enhancer of polycomb homolog 2-like [Cucurbita maxima]XP_022969624.1 enhancer of polycomb homolog 2-like [Cucurbita maxima]
MSRLSFRPRPLDIHKKLPIVKSVKELEDDETPTSTRNSQLLRLATEVDNEVHQVPCKKLAPDIPTPEFVVVDTYEIDYSRTFSQPTSYLRGRGARTELGEFVEYDLDNEDEDWLQDFNRERKILTPERFESFLFKLEVLDHKARERAGIITTTLGSPIPVLLQRDNAIEALQTQAIRYSIIESVYDYWKEKRERWQKPVLRRLQPPPPVNDTNPYNVFRPREKAHRLHTRRMQRRENNVQSFEKLRQVRRNLEQAKTLLEALIKREEKKRDLMESEVSLQRVHLKYKHETELLEESLALPRFLPFSCKFGSSEDEFVELDDIATSRPPRIRISGSFRETNMIVLPTESMKQENRQQLPHGWLHKMDPLEPVLLFAKPLVAEKLAAANIVPPSAESPTRNSVSMGSHKLRGRIGRGGRIIFDRWNPLMQTGIDCSSNSYYSPPKQSHLAYN